jgi:superoxide dismutase
VRCRETGKERRHDGHVHSSRTQLRLRCARAAHQRSHHGAPPLEAPRHLRRWREHGARAARGGALDGHSIFWTNLTPEGQERPEGEIAAAIEEHFGSFEGFQGQFNAAALGIQGSGWAGLFWDSIGENLIIQQFFDQQSQFAAGTVPILLLDMWEHAFYLDYQNVKADYVKAFWNIVNWDNVAERLATAREKTSGLLIAR